MRDLRNKTLSEATAAMKVLSTPKASLAKIELLVCLTAFLLILLTFFGSWRRRHHNPKVRILLFLAYNLSSYLIAYTLGLMTEASFQNQLLPVWAIFLMIFFGSSDSYSAHSVEDCEQWINYFWQYVIKVCGLSFLWSTYANKSPMILALFVLLLIVPLKVGQRAASLLAASRYGQQVTTKLIADYMISEPRSSEGNLDPIPMRGYNYIVRGEETIFSLKKLIGKLLKKLKGKEAAAPREGPDYRTLLEITDRVVTIEKVWKCEGWLLRSDGGDKDSKLKDICLSFSLYKLLRLRFGGYSLPKQAHEKVWKLMQHLYAQGDGYERAFGVVELELSFLFDLFYTNYPMIFQPGRLKLKVMELLFLVIGSLVTISLCFLRYNSNRPRDEVQLATTGGLSIDALVTALILIVFTCVELVQFFFTAISDWAKVILLCKYVQTPSWQEENKWMGKLVGLICRKESRKPWDRKLRQYSLLDQARYCKKQCAPAELSPKVKKAVFRSLMSNGRMLKNGKASLRLNEVQDELSWACDLETQTQVIIVWHIATSICEQEMRISNPNFRAATCLSKYLAYLVAFSPELLPDHPFNAKYIFIRIVSESRKLLKGCNTKQERIWKLKEIGQTRDDTRSVMNQGTQLGQQLLEMDVNKGRHFIWKVLAEFWSELMVYVAPSDDAKAHAEHLAMGGEFVTHLWALISHAGIEREPPVERPPLSTEAEAGPIDCDIARLLQC